MKRSLIQGYAIPPVSLRPAFSGRELFSPLLCYPGCPWFLDDADVSLTDCQILNNQGVSTGTNVFGGGLYADQNSNVVLNNVILDGNICNNSSRTYGAAIYIRESGGIWNRVTVANRNYTVGIWAQGLSNNPCTLNVSNALISANQINGSAGWSYGAGMYVRSYCTVDLMNCTFADNEYSGTGSQVCANAIHSDGNNSTIQATNCIFWNPGNGRPELKYDLFRLVYCEPAHSGQPKTVLQSGCSYHRYRQRWRIW